MSQLEVRVPQLPESVADATLVAWRKQPGDAVNRDENLVDLETDKVVLEVPAPASGVIRELKVENGATVTSGQILAVIEEGASAAAKPAAKVEAKADGRGEPKTAAKAEARPEAKTSAAEPAKSQGDKLAPSVRRLVEEHKLEPATIAGSGRDGRITKGDVLTHLAGKDAAPAPAAAKPTEPGHAGSRDRRRTRGTSRADDPSACTHRRAARAGAVDRGDADDVQRSRPEGRQRAARALQGKLREGARRPPGLHVVLRQGRVSRR